MVIKNYFFEATDSTQDEARKLLDAGEVAPFLVTAAEQSAGRGRMARPWISPPGNFYSSLAWRATLPMARYGEYSFVTAVALLITLREIAAGDFALKWPNDILLGGRKCAGILIESYGAQNEFLIIGIGVNLRHAPPDDAVRTPAAALWPDAAQGRGRDAKFATQLVENFINWHEQYIEQGFESIRAEWLTHAYNLGQNMIVKTPQDAVQGIFAGIDEHGNLLLTQGDQTRKITAADVS